MNLTGYQLALICGLVYFDPPDRMQKRIGCSLCVEQLARGILGEGPPCGPDAEQIKALGDILNEPPLLDLRVIAYINHNDTNGFVAYAFGNARGEVLCAFRGSESKAGCAPTNVDWWDNISAPFDGSVQYPDIRRFTANYARVPLLLTGHSKGAHNALYALATSKNPAARAICYDGQGFTSGQLTGDERAALAARAVNYVQQYDVVGALLCHPEKRVFVKATLDGNPHMLTSMVFGDDGWPVPACRSLRSVATEALSRTLAAKIKQAIEPEEAGATASGGLRT